MKTLIMTLALVGSAIASSLPSEFDRDIYTSGEKIFDSLNNIGSPTL